MTEEKRKMKYVSCGSNSSEPSCTSPQQTTPLSDGRIKRVVRHRYEQIAAGEMPSSNASSPEAPTTPDEVGEMIGYSEGELKSIPEEANLGLGCGNPVALASIQPGEVVVDLGSGAGIDCFLAAQKVGATGQVIGVDMTPQMIDKARENARQGAYDNVEFRLGEIEHMPVANGTADLIISNCVINLAPNKVAVYRDAYRALKPGGRVMISDLILLEELPESVTNSLEEGLSCVAGAMTKEDYLDAIRSAGFEEIEILSEKYTSEFREPPENQEKAMKPKVIVDGREVDLDLTPAEVESLAKAVLAVNIKAIKPQQENQMKDHYIPFKLSKMSNHISVPVFVNDKGPFDFTLDTGATATTLSKSLADELGIETYDDDREETRAIGIPHKSAKVESLAIGPDTFENEEILVIDFVTVLGPHGANVKGLIGHTTLKKYKLSVNYQIKILSLEKGINEASINDERIHWIDFEYIEDSHLVGVPVFINGSGPFSFVVDTGAGGTVVTSKLAEKLELSLDSSDVQVLAPGGGTGGNFAVLEQLSVASATQENASVVVLDLKAVSSRGSLIHNGILGYPFLKDYEVVIDYPNKKFALIDQRGNQ